MNKSKTRYGEKLVPDYSQLAEAARASGLLVFGHDHVGHGKSEGERGQVRVRQEFNTEVFFFVAVFRLWRLHRAVAGTL